MWPNLTVRETHAIFAGYYRAPRDVDEVIAVVGLREKAGARVKTLSGGQKRRLDLGIALIGDPELVFLDEPTTASTRRRARRVGDDPLASLARQDRPAHDAYLDEASSSPIAWP
jgi:ABC-2 type transport system ATP-binding protein